MKKNPPPRQSENLKPEREALKYIRLKLIHACTRGCENPVFAGACVRAGSKQAACICWYLALIAPPRTTSKAGHSAGAGPSFCPPRALLLPFVFLKHPADLVVTAGVQGGVHRGPRPLVVDARERRGRGGRRGPRGCRPKPREELLELGLGRVGHQRELVPGGKGRRERRVSGVRIHR